MTIKLYEVNPDYIDYLVPYAPHLFQNKQPGQYNERKYIGVVLSIKMQDKIRNQAAEVYKHKMKQGNATALAKRCNDFLLLEEKCKQFMTKRSDYENRHL